MMQQTEQIWCQRGAFSGSATIKPVSDSKPASERVLGRRGDPLGSATALFPGIQDHTTAVLTLTHMQDVTCAGYREDISVPQVAD